MSYMQANKRQRIGGGGGGPNSNDISNFNSRNDFKSNNNGNNMNTNNMCNNNNNIKLQPSFVVHARNLSENVNESDVHKALERFGKINSVHLMARKRQAFIEFADINGAINCVNEANRNLILIGGAPSYLNYSNSQKNDAHDDDDMKVENNILLFTVLNPLYPITVEVIHTICSTVAGKVLRIVIFRKNGVQAMIEFDSLDTALRVKQSLNNADIYSGCCTLKIDFAKTTKLNVIRNDQDSWDFTIDDPQPPQRKQPLLQTPYLANGKPTPFNSSSASGKPVNSSQSMYGSDNDIFPSKRNFSGLQNPSYNQSNFMNQGQNKSFKQQGLTNMQNSFNRLLPNNFGNSDIPSLMPNDEYYETNDMPIPTSSQIVLMVYNLCKDKFNCDRLFNLFCLYGNVDRIKFLMSKEGVAMLQMSNAEAIFGALTHLNNTYIFGKKMQIHVSKQNVLQPVPRPRDLSDGTTSYKDYTRNRNNRYSNLESASKNKPLPPANVLHFFNAPPGMDEQQIIDVFSRSGAKKPMKVKVFPKKSDKSSTGLAEWNNIADSIEAMILANHLEISHSSSKFPYIFKLCFSATPILDEKN